MNFADLRLAEPILRSLKQEGYDHPTPIQAQAIPDILRGRDLLGAAQTGTGKTAAFALPILHRLFEKHRGEKKHLVRCLVLAPTRELAVQIDESFRTYGRHLGLKHAAVFGGVSQHGQTQAISRGVDILVATPGRLLDLMNQGLVSLSQVEIFVLDEADRMLDMGFINDIRKVIARLPAHRQTLMFSATMPHDIRDLANTILNNPATVAVTPVASTVDRIDQCVYFVDRKNKPQLLAHLINNSAISRALVFTRTKHGADRVVRQLHRSGIRAEAIHGNKTQNARQRALLNFRTGKTPILIASDIASRGIDVDDISHVFNYDLTHEPETYVHRIGRTARAGADGHAVSFCDREERPNLVAIEKLIRQKIRVEQEQPKYAEPDRDHYVSTSREPRHSSHATRGAGGGNGSHRSGSNGSQSSHRRNGQQPSRQQQPRGAKPQATGRPHRDGSRSSAPQHPTSQRSSQSNQQSQRSGQRTAPQQPGRPRAKHPLDRNRSAKYTSQHAKHR